MQLCPLLFKYKLSPVNFDSSLLKGSKINFEISKDLYFVRYRIWSYAKIFSELTKNKIVVALIVLWKLEID